MGNECPPELSLRHERELGELSANLETATEHIASLSRTVETVAATVRELTDSIRQQQHQLRELLDIRKEIATIHVTMNDNQVALKESIARVHRRVDDSCTEVKAIINKHDDRLAHLEAQVLELQGRTSHIGWFNTAHKTLIEKYGWVILLVLFLIVVTSPYFKLFLK